MNFTSFLLYPDENFNVDLLNENIIHQKFDSLLDLLNLNGYAETKRIIEMNVNYNLANSSFSDMKISNTLLNLAFADNSLKLLIAAKIGANTFQDFSFDHSKPFFKFTKEAQNKQIFSSYYEDLIKHQRVLLIFRPFTLKSNLNELILLLFKNNGFLIVKRSIVSLTLEEAYYLSKIEKIPDYSIDAYIQYMTQGQIEFVLMTEYGGYEKAKFLCNGVGNSTQDNFQSKPIILKNKTAYVNFNEIDVLEFNNPFKCLISCKNS